MKKRTASLSTAFPRRGSACARCSVRICSLLLTLITLLLLSPAALPVCAEENTPPVTVTTTAAEETPDTTPEVTFSDISGHWAEATILKWKDAGILSGYPDGTFQPDKPVTRAELAKIVTLAFGLTETSEVSYSDIDVNEWYYPYLRTAAAYIPCYCPPDLVATVIPYQDIISMNQFMPSGETLRVHAAETLSLIYTKLNNITVEFPSDNDLLNIMKERFSDGWYEVYLIIRPSQGVPKNQLRVFQYSWLASELGLMQGDPDSYFRPYDAMTRAEFITIIDRILPDGIVNPT